MKPQTAAGYTDARFRPTAIVAGGDRTPLGPGEVVQGTDPAQVVRVDRQVVVVADGDAVLVDEEQRVTGLRGRDGSTKLEVPAGSATLRGDRIEVATDKPTVVRAIPATARVEMRGTYAIGETSPVGGRVETARTVGAIAAGSILLGASYLPTLIAGASSTLDKDRALLVPVVGPWIDLASRDHCVNPPEVDVPGFEGGIDKCTEETVNRVALVTSGVAQLLGTVVLGLGLLPRAVYVRDLQVTGLRVFPSYDGKRGRLQLGFDF